MNDGRMVMVIDDEVDTLATVFDALSSEGYRVATANGADDALSILGRVRPDLIICDMRMPGLDGMEVLARMRVMVPKVKFIFLTAYGTPELYRMGLEMGARDMILKPFRVEELLRVVKHLMGEEVNSQ
jgi:two-component system response regulator (stage 0 sporulation protein F)